MPRSLSGTHWKCTDENMPENGMKCVVVEGNMDPYSNGENDIEVKYQDGSTLYMKLRRFQMRHKQIIPEYTPKARPIHAIDHLELRGGH